MASSVACFEMTDKHSRSLALSRRSRAALVCSEHWQQVASNANCETTRDFKRTVLYFRCAFQSRVMPTQPLKAISKQRGIVWLRRLLWDRHLYLKSVPPSKRDQMAEAVEHEHSTYIEACIHNALGSEYFIVIYLFVNYHNHRYNCLVVIPVHWYAWLLLIF